MIESRISSEKGARAERDWTQGSITRNLLSLTWPVLISQGLNMIGPFIDTIWVGRLGAASVAGVGIAGLAVILANSAVMGLTVGMRALIARFVGAGDNKAAVHTTRQAFVVSVGYSVVMAVIGAFLAEPILRAFGVDAEVVREGAAYMRIQFIGIITMFLVMFNDGAMQASGDTINPMRIAIIFRAIHVAICPFLVLGWWIFPQLGVSGASASSVIAQGLGGIIGLWVLFSGRTRLRLNLRNWRLDPDIMWRMVKIGIPNGLMHIQQHLSMLALIWFIAPFGTLAVAAHTLSQRIDAVLATFSMGVGLGSGVLGGQNIGARKVERAEKSGWVAAGFISAIMLVGLVVVLLWAEEITSIFSAEPDLVKITGTFLRISAVSYIALGLGSLFRHFLTGVGDTLPALLFEVIPTWGILIPLAYFLPKIGDLGVYGIRWAIAIRLILGGIIFLLYFWLGRWTHKRV